VRGGSRSVKQDRTARSRDLPYGEQPLAVRWQKRQYRRLEQACQGRAFTESVAEVPARARMTGRPCRKAEAASGRGVSAAWRAFGVPQPGNQRRRVTVALQRTTITQPVRG
jgi:transposase